LEIKYLKHNQIDKQKWDSAIENAQNGLAYALSWYLDIVSPNWDALIFGDYEMVMPLIHKKKYTFHILSIFYIFDYFNTFILCFEIEFREIIFFIYLFNF